MLPEHPKLPDQTHLEPYGPDVAAVIDGIRPRSLKTKLFVGAAGLGLLVFLSTVWALNRSVRRAACHEAREHAAALLSLFADGAAESVAAGDRIQLHVFANALLRNGIYAVRVLRNDGSVVFSSHDDLAPDPLHEVVRFQSNGGCVLFAECLDGQSYLHAVRTIQFGDRPVGVAHMWLNRDDLESRVRDVSTPLYPIFGIGFALMVIVGFLLLVTPFRALERLQRAALRIGSGDLSRRVPVNGKDEIASLCQVFNEMAEGLERAQDEVLCMHLETVHAMINFVEAKDEYTEGHCLRVSSLAHDILGCYDLPREERFLIETAALLHDIGKIGVPDQILLKNDRLTPEEEKVIQRHVTIGESVLARLESMRRMAPWVRHHHERWDGGGYPDGLGGEEIPFASRVITVADTIDAMMTDRPYRKGLRLSEVVRVLEDERGRQLDPEIVEHAIFILTGKKRAHEQTDETADERDGDPDSPRALELQSASQA